MGTMLWNVRSNAIRRAWSALGSLLILIVAIILRHHYTSLASICNSGTGRLGQAQSGCGTDSTMSSLSLWLIILSALWLIGSASGLYGARRQTMRSGWRTPPS